MSLIVEQAARPLHEVLGLTSEETCGFIRRLEDEHIGRSQTCKIALKPIYTKQTLQDYFWATLSVGVVGAGIGAGVKYLRSRGGPLMAYDYRAHLIFGAAIGAVLGAMGTFFSEEVNLQKANISMNAEAEKIWMRLQQPIIEEALKQAQAAVTGYSGEALKVAQTTTDKGDPVVRDTIKIRDQLLSLKAYFERVVGAYHPSVQDRVLACLPLTPT
jgi:hypothetical protein